MLLDGKKRGSRHWRDVKVGFQNRRRRINTVREGFVVYVPSPFLPILLFAHSDLTKFLSHSDAKKRGNNGKHFPKKGGWKKKKKAGFAPLAKRATPLPFFFPEGFERPDESSWLYAKDGWRKEKEACMPLWPKPKRIFFLYTG